MSGRTQLVKILFLAANPNGTKRLYLDKEIRRIELALERAKNRERFRIIQKWAVTDDDLRRALLDHEPEIVHFSGHSGGSQGLVFADDGGNLRVISGEALGRLFGLCADHVRCVVLNACYSKIQAQEISRHIEYVIGMSQDIGDDAAIKFSEGFYDALGAGKPTGEAFKFGRVAIELKNLPDHMVPIVLHNSEVRRFLWAPALVADPSRIVIRGLRSFEPEDSDFFLGLLPGPRGPDGLPTSIRFWKSRIEEAISDRTFSVGLIYGPSGCGKSSLVKAGLLPRLPESIQPIFVEATADETEARLMRGLRGVNPVPGEPDTLIDALIGLRKNLDATGRKVLIVIDQFEQWLHARAEKERSVLALALRLCDGVHLQCILMIRDDFWVSNKRFLEDVGVRISEGENAALVDLFGLQHAKYVLRMFAEATGEELPADEGERDRFLGAVASGLAQDERVICIRLALFYQLFKGRPWNEDSLRQEGGIEGVGVIYLEDTFSASIAPAENRYHQKAVRAVLNALLPEPGAAIKGKMRSYEELLGVSGYSDRLDDFKALLQILDSKTHLITPTDPERLEPDRPQGEEPKNGRYYQLTHDYLVPSIWEWLTRKQKETRRGRAEMLLRELTNSWKKRSLLRQEDAYFAGPNETIELLSEINPNSLEGDARTFLIKSAKKNSKTFVKINSKYKKLFYISVLLFPIIIIVCIFINIWMTEKHWGIVFGFILFVDMFFIIATGALYLLTGIYNNFAHDACFRSSDKEILNYLVKYHSKMQARARKTNL